jgi:hypothetical protein
MNEATSSALETPTKGQWTFLWKCTLGACFVLLLAFSVRKIATNDIGFHLKGGQWIFQHHSVPRVDSFTYTATGHEYVDSHWLYQALLYAFYKFSGYSSITWLNAAVLLLAFGFTFLRVMGTGAAPWIQCLLLFTAVIVMEKRFFARPEIFSWLFLTVTLWILDEWAARRRDLLYLLPVLQLVWANMEGLFVLGWIVFILYGVGEWFHKGKVDKRLVQWMGLAAAADLANPYFLKGIAYPFGFLSKLDSQNIYNQTIGELHSPWHYLSGPVRPHYAVMFIVVYAIFSFLTLALFLVTFRKRKFQEGMLFAVFFFMSSTAVRNVPLFMLVSLPLASVCLKDFSDSAGPVLREIHHFLSKDVKTAVFFLAFVVLTALRVFNDAYYLSEGRDDRFGWGIDEDRFPVKATAFLTQNHLDGKILNHLNLGGWLDWQAPQPTFIDGRHEVMGDSLYLDFTRSLEPGGLAGLITEYRPQLVIFEYSVASPWSDQMAQMPGWRLIYVDECAALYAAKDYAPAFPGLSEGDLPASLHLPMVSDEDAARALQALKPPSFAGWFGGFYQRQVFPYGLMNLAVFAANHRQYAAAQSLYLEVLRQCGGKSYLAFYNLGMLYLGTQKYFLAKLCLERELDLRPGDVEALQLLSQMSAEPGV